MTEIEKKRVHVVYMALAGALYLVCFLPFFIAGNGTAVIFDEMMFYYVIAVVIMAVVGIIGGFVASKFTSNRFLVLLASFLLGHISLFILLLLTFTGA